MRQKKKKWEEISEREKERKKINKVRGRREKGEMIGDRKGRQGGGTRRRKKNKREY